MLHICLEEYHKIAIKSTDIGLKIRQLRGLVAENLAAQSI
jgi:hypothetical protein